MGKAETAKKLKKEEKEINSLFIWGKQNNKQKFYNLHKSQNTVTIWSPSIWIPGRSGFGMSSEHWAKYVWLFLPFYLRVSA